MLKGKRPGKLVEEEVSLSTCAALFKRVPDAMTTSQLDEALISKWKTTAFICLVSRPTETPEQITALLNIPEIQARFLQHSKGEVFLGNLAMKNPAYPDAMLASTICDNSAELRANIGAVKQTAGHQCCAHKV